MEKVMDKKKVLIIGTKGMAGHMIFNYLKETASFEVFGIARNIPNAENIFNIDVSNTEELKKIFEDIKFDYVINCIGILNKDAEDHPSKAIWFNSYFPHFLEEITENTSTKVIHISTDCVFSGSRGAYTENDFRDGKGFYAQSKALGEIINKKDVTIRTSIIGPELNNDGIGLFHWFMSQPTSGKLKGYSKAYWSGLTTLELAKAIVQIIEQDITGLIQIAPQEKIDKFNLISLFNTLYLQGQIEIKPDDQYIVDKSLKSVRKDFNYKVPNYKDMLAEQKKWIQEHQHLYSYRIV
ncbi:dTDP-4-dehydrorhamnose reductase family protein [Kaistella palustris]|uniref:dTDP-4-dehydrorhamnose reductase family protein n=1 Tax=Kaistella palustris TaxID=493376 RepID=UPI000687E23C|nr:SDR family oxidoreductase [Kaistella palustris]